MKIPGIIILISVSLLLIAPVSMASTQPVLFGKAANNGDLLGLYYTDPLGQVVIVNTSTMVPVDSLDMIVYSPFSSGPVNLTVYTFQYTQENLTLKGSNNTTITRSITIQDVISYDNQSVPSTAKQIQISSIGLPSTTKDVFVEVSYDGAVFIFTHKTTPNSIPVFLTQGGELGLVIVLFVLASLVWSLGALTSKMILKRARYWPKRSASSWIIIFFILAIAMYFFFGTFYYDLGYIQWYYFLIPVWFLSVMVMLGWWDPNVERWELMLIKGTKHEKVYEDIEKIYAAPHARHKWIRIDRDSRVEAVKRVFGIYTPIVFYEGPPPWYMENEEWEDPIWDTKRVYLLDPKRGPAHTLRKETWRFWIFSRHTTEFHIPLSGHYSRDAAEFLGEMTAVFEISEENEELRVQNRNYKIKYETGKLKVGYEELNALTKELHGAEFEYHSPSVTEQKPDPKGSRDQEKKEEPDGKEGKE